MSEDLISRSALMEDANKHFGHPNAFYSNESFKELIKKQPTIEAVPVVHGFNDNRNYQEADEFRCSVCGLHLEDWVKCVYDEESGDESWVGYAFKYCPECGAKIEK